jgi:hypothetical protein
MKRGSIPLWLLRDLPALIGIALSFWPLKITVISTGRRAMLGKQISPPIYECIMHMLPIAEEHLHYALCRQGLAHARLERARGETRTLSPDHKLVRRHQGLRVLSRPVDGPARSRNAVH